mgnify:FL=1
MLWLKYMYLIRAYLFTDSATNAQRRRIEKFRSGTLRFGIMAPSAPKRTAFEKNDGSQPRPVMRTKPLYFEYGNLVPLFRHSAPFSR